MAVRSLGKHYYKDDERGYYYDFFDGEFNCCDYDYFDTLEECQEDMAYQESIDIQHEELRWEYLCSW